MIFKEPGVSCKLLDAFCAKCEVHFILSSVAILQAVKPFCAYGKYFACLAVKLFCVYLKCYMLSYKAILCIGNVCYILSCQDVLCIGNVLMWLPVRVSV